MLKQSDLIARTWKTLFATKRPNSWRRSRMHAQTCPACQTELVLWREISAAAVTMKKEWPSPCLWPRISESLENESAQPRGWRSWIRGRSSSPAFRWQLALATIAILAVSGTTAFSCRIAMSKRAR